MTTIKQLLQELERRAGGRLTTHTYHVQLPLEDAARLAALAEMYPRKTEVQLITELLSAALDEVEGNLPYLEGPRVVAEDDHGDPIYEDVGPNRRFQELLRHHHLRLQEELDGEETALPSMESAGSP